MERLIGWLEANLPPDDGQRCLVHGDYRLDNLVFAPDAPDIRAVLDWELSTTGHPYADLAAVLMQWSMPATAEGRGLAGVDRAALGLWSDAEFVARYCERRGMAPIADFGFYLAFAHFRMAAILQGVLRRALDGNAADPERGRRLGAYVPEFARAGLAAAEGRA
jgi:aminoglycoside phosphotransferase (APT) family kinase protein